MAIDISKQRDFELLVELSATVKERVSKRSVEKGSITPIFPNENVKVLTDNPNSQSVENPMLQGVVGSVSSSDSYSEGCGLDKDEDAELFLADRVVPLDDVEVMSCGLDGRAGGEDLELPVVKSGNEVDELRTESKCDISLEVPRGLAERDQQGYKWVDGVLMKFIRDDFGESRKLVVLPAKFRQ